MLLPHELYGSQALQSRSLYTESPPARTSIENRPTLLVSWWCTGFALAIILVRISGRYIRTERLFREDKIMALSIIPLMARMGLVHVILLWGTNNAVINGTVDATSIAHREIGSKLVLASRIMYAAFLWIAKFTVSEFLKRLTSQAWKRTYELGLQIIRYFLIVTFVAVVIATLSECHPFQHYWQVRPDPGGKCREGVAQLMTSAVSDVVTDVLLVCFPIPIVLKSHMPLKRKISLVLLFALSLILVAITIYRVIGVIDRNYEQQFRSLLASLEILAAATVSNALVLGSFVRDRGTKKQRWRHESTGAISSQEHRMPTPRRVITHRDWGSDADLVNDLGISCAPELSEKGPAMPRPAPVALPSGTHANRVTPMPKQGAQSRDGPSLEVRKEQAAGISSNSPSGTSFFDIGGLLGADEAPTEPRQHSIAAVPHYRNFSRPGSPLRAASVAVMSGTGDQRNHIDEASSHDHGFASSGKATEEVSQEPNGNGMSLMDVLREPGPLTTAAQDRQPDSRRGSPPEIQDAGGLLSSAERSSSGQQDMSLVDVLRQTGPTPIGTNTAPLQGGGTSPEIQDIGGLLGPKPDAKKGKRKPSHSGSNRNPVQPRNRKTETSEFQDVGGLLS